MRCNPEHPSFGRPSIIYVLQHSLRETRTAPVCRELHRSNVAPIAEKLSAAVDILVQSAQVNKLTASWTFGEIRYCVTCRSHTGQGRRSKVKVIGWNVVGMSPSEGNYSHLIVFIFFQFQTFVFRALVSAAFCCLCVLLTHCFLFYFHSWFLCVCVCVTNKFDLIWFDLIQHTLLVSIHAIFSLINH